MRKNPRVRWDQLLSFLRCWGLWPYLKPVAEWRERLIGRCFPVVTFICLITEEKLVQVKEFPLT